MGEKVRYILTEIKQFLTNRLFLLNLLGIFVFLVVVIFGVLYWLRIYTHHGQQLVLPDYVDTHIAEAKVDAQKNSFDIIVSDSVHIVGQPGGIIQTQNPPGGAIVKEKRKIYVRVTKYLADQVDLTGITLYGQSFPMKKAFLERKGVKTNVIGRRNDNGTDNIILEVSQNGKTLISSSKKADGLKIDKGSTLDFIISTTEGGTSTIPNLIGKSVKAARFMAPHLTIEVHNTSLGEDTPNATIISQSPEYDGLSTLPNGSVITVTIGTNQ